MKFYIILYNIFIVPLLFFTSKILVFFSPKMRSRSVNLKSSLSNLDKLKHNNKYTIWIHASSMGEFEQAKPIIEALKSDINKSSSTKNIQIVCSFFSSSGYNTQKNYSHTDVVCYLPLDTRKNAKKFISMLNPDIAIFVRYELWFNYLFELKKQKIYTLLINATFPSALKKYKFLKGAYTSIFNLFDKIYTISNEQTLLFNSLEKIHTKIITSSDTRIERIMQKVTEAKTKPVLPRSYFGDDKTIIVAGSTWEPDENYLIEAHKKLNKIYKNKIILILAPHEPTEKHINKIKSKNTCLLSEILLYNYSNYSSNSNLVYNSNNNSFSNNNIISSNNNIIIVDSIGKLLKLYGTADAAYVGGAFGSAGVHSLTEPAGYGIPICTGKNCYNSPDAKSLYELGALTIAESEEDIFNWMERILLDKNFVSEAGAAATNYIKNNSGATETILKEIKKQIN